MSRGRHTEAQMIGALKQMEAGRKAEDVAREVGVSKHTIYAWKAKYGGMDVSQAQEVKQLREENTRLRKRVADLSLDKEALQSVIRKNWCVERKIELVHIQPGKPVQNGRLESFHARLREECLRVSWFQNLFDARRKIVAWRKAGVQATRG